MGSFVRDAFTTDDEAPEATEGVDRSSGSSRRRLLAGAATGCLATLSGCSGSIPGFSTETEPTAGTEPETGTATATADPGPQLASSFETDALSNWTIPQDGPSEERSPRTVDTWASEGSRSLALTAVRGPENNASVRSQRGDGLGVYPEPGDVLRFRLRERHPDVGGYRLRLGVPAGVRYVLDFNYANERLDLKVDDAVKDSVTLEMEPSRTYTVRFEWGRETIRAHYETDDGETVGRLGMSPFPVVEGGAIELNRWSGNPMVTAFTDELVVEKGGAE